MARGGARGPYRAGRQRRAEIIDAAVEVFADRGFRAGTIKDVADAVGLTPAAVLRYFSKEELLTEVLQHWNEQQRDVAANEAGLAYFRGLRNLMTFHLEHRGYLELYLTFATEASKSEHPAHEFMYARYASSIATMQRKLREAIRRGEVAPMDEATVVYEASCMHAVLDGMEMQWLLNPRVDLVGLVGEYVDQAINRWRAGARAQSVPAPAGAWPD